MALTSIITAKPPSSYRNDLNLSCGFRFTANREITVTGLGRAVLSVFAQSHMVYLWSNAGSILASCEVTTSSERIGDFAYEEITPVTLASGTTYRISSDEYNLGDTWCDNQSIAAYYDTADITVTGSCYQQPRGSFPIIVVSSGTFAYGWPTLIEGSSVNAGHRRRSVQNSIRSVF